LFYSDNETISGIGLAACVLMATTKEKRASTFFVEKSAPQEKILAMLPTLGDLA